MAGSSTYRILVLAIVAALAIGACSDDNVTGPGDVPEMSVLGMGYDVFSNYADPAEVCAGFLDVVI